MDAVQFDESTGPYYGGKQENIRIKLYDSLCCLKTVQHKSCGEGAVLRGSRSLNLAAVARSLATSLLRRIGGTTLRALNPGVSVNLATENEGQRVLGKEGARWDFACSAR
ncbi:hypothetical protein AVEN_190772-1 [Araneus ventricosus]|uniref:Uncharacterized protein n=1 Tax=Araneus ventricosus TaxID=182803 RepID=A0A4Y2TZD2_ARAVE|nr:hypothetical protein AVEN_190772-1 [Araneus ventricosus]